MWEPAVTDPYAAIADELRVRVRERGPKDNRRWLVASMRAVSQQRVADWPALAMELAKAIPDTVPWDELTVWTRGGLAHRKVAAHGTVAGARRHRKLGEKPCDACAAAERERLRRYRQANKNGGTVTDRARNAAVLAAVESPDPATLTLDERRVEARRLAELELPVASIARHLRTDPRVVRGWVADVNPFDEAAVRRAMSGEWVELSLADKREAVRRMAARGDSALDIAGRLGLSRRQVERHKAWLRDNGKLAA